MPGDVLLGIASSGLHSNGFSLVRKVISLTGLSYSSPCPWDEDKTLALSLLEPTRIYIKQVLPAVRAGLLKGMSHITGGGFIENIPRVLPKGMGVWLDASAWQLPPVFRFLMRHGAIEPLEMARTFNNGIGLVIIVGREDVERAMEVLQGSPGAAAVYRIGEVTDKSGVEMQNLEHWCS
jgi:phosphoribosylamine--glycine ligase/phosphoribosylformylglycinamidine cyclo-ligase